jgi:hypothetical protein
LNKGVPHSGVAEARSDLWDDHFRYPAMCRGSQKTLVVLPHTRIVRGGAFGVTQA